MLKSLLKSVLMLSSVSLLMAQTSSSRLELLFTVVNNQYKCVIGSQECPTDVAGNRIYDTTDTATIFLNNSSPQDVSIGTNTSSGKSIVVKNGVVQVQDENGNTTFSNFTASSSNNDVPAEVKTFVLNGDLPQSTVNVSSQGFTGDTASGNVVFLGNAKNISINASGTDGKNGLNAGQSAAYEAAQGKFNSSTGDTQAALAALFATKANGSSDNLLSNSSFGFSAQDLNSNVNLCDSIPGNYKTPQIDGSDYIFTVKKANDSIVFRSICERQTNEEYSLQTICARAPETKRTLSCFYPDLVKKVPVWKRPTEKKVVSLICAPNNPMTGYWKSTCAEKNYGVIASAIRAEYVVLAPSPDIAAGHRSKIYHHYTNLANPYAMEDANWGNNAISASAGGCQADFQDGLDNNSNNFTIGKNPFDIISDAGNAFGTSFTALQFGRDGLINGSQTKDSSEVTAAKMKCLNAKNTKIDYWREAGAYVYRYNRPTMPGQGYSYPGDNKLDERDQKHPNGTTSESAKDITKATYWFDRQLARTRGDTTAPLAMTDYIGTSAKTPVTPDYLLSNNSKTLEFQQKNKFPNSDIAANFSVLEKNGNVPNSPTSRFLDEIVRLSYDRPKIQDALIEYSSIKITRALTLDSNECGQGTENLFRCNDLNTILKNNNFSTVSLNTSYTPKFSNVVEYRFKDTKMGLSLKFNEPNSSNKSLTRALTRAELKDRVLYLPAGAEIKPILKTKYCKEIKVDDNTDLLTFGSSGNNFIGPERAAGSTIKINPLGGPQNTYEKTTTGSLIEAQKNFTVNPPDTEDKLQNLDAFTNGELAVGVRSTVDPGFKPTESADLGAAISYFPTNAPTPPLVEAYPWANSFMRVKEIDMKSNATNGTSCSTVDITHELSDDQQKIINRLSNATGVLLVATYDTVNDENVIRVYFSPSVKKRIIQSDVPLQTADSLQNDHFNNDLIADSVDISMSLTPGLFLPQVEVGPMTLKGLQSQSLTGNNATFSPMKESKTLASRNAKTSSNASNPFGIGKPGPDGSQEAYGIPTRETSDLTTSPKLGNDPFLPGYSLALGLPDDKKGVMTYYSIPNSIGNNSDKGSCYPANEFPCQKMTNVTGLTGVNLGLDASKAYINAPEFYDTNKNIPRYIKRLSVLRLTDNNDITRKQLNTNKYGNNVILTNHVGYLANNAAMKQCLNDTFIDKFKYPTNIISKKIEFTDDGRNKPANDMQIPNLQNTNGTSGHGSSTAINGAFGAADFFFQEKVAFDTNTLMAPYYYTNDILPVYRLNANGVDQSQNQAYDMSDTSKTGPVFMARLSPENYALNLQYQEQTRGEANPDDMYAADPNVAYNSVLKKGFNAQTMQLYLDSTDRSRYFSDAFIPTTMKRLPKLLGTPDVRTFGAADSGNYSEPINLAQDYNSFLASQAMNSYMTAATGQNNNLLKISLREELYSSATNYRALRTSLHRLSEKTRLSIGSMRANILNLNNKYDTSKFTMEYYTTVKGSKCKSWSSNFDSGECISRHIKGSTRWKVPGSEASVEFGEPQYKNRIYPNEASCLLNDTNKDYCLQYSAISPLRATIPPFMTSYNQTVEIFSDGASQANNDVGFLVDRNFKPSTSGSAYFTTIYDEVKAVDFSSLPKDESKDFTLLNPADRTEPNSTTRLVPNSEFWVKDSSTKVSSSITPGRNSGIATPFISRTNSSWFGTVSPFSQYWVPLYANNILGANGVYVKANDASLIGYDRANFKYGATKTASSSDDSINMPGAELLGINLPCEFAMPLNLRGFKPWYFRHYQCPHNYSYYAGMFMPFVRSKAWLFEKSTLSRVAVNQTGEFLADNTNTTLGRLPTMAPIKTTDYLGTILGGREQNSDNTSSGGAEWNRGGLGLPAFGVTGVKVEFSRVPLAARYIQNKDLPNSGNPTPDISDGDLNYLEATIGLIHGGNLKTIMNSGFNLSVYQNLALSPTAQAALPENPSAAYNALITYKSVRASASEAASPTPGASFNGALSRGDYSENNPNDYSYNKSLSVQEDLGQGLLGEKQLKSSAIEDQYYDTKDLQWIGLSGYLIKDCNFLIGNQTAAALPFEYAGTSGFDLPNVSVEWQQDGSTSGYWDNGSDSTLTERDDPSYAKTSSTFYLPKGLDLSDYGELYYGPLVSITTVADLSSSYLQAPLNAAKIGFLNYFDKNNNINANKVIAYEPHTRIGGETDYKFASFPYIVSEELNMNFKDQYVDRKAAVKTETANRSALFDLGDFSYGNTAPKRRQVTVGRAIQDAQLSLKPTAATTSAPLTYDPEIADVPEVLLSFFLHSDFGESGDISSGTVLKKSVGLTYFDEILGPFITKHQRDQIVRNTDEYTFLANDIKYVQAWSYVNSTTASAQALDYLAPFALKKASVDESTSRVAENIKFSWFMNKDSLKFTTISLNTSAAGPGPDNADTLTDYQSYSSAADKIGAANDSIQSVFSGVGVVYNDGKVFGALDATLASKDANGAFPTRQSGLTDEMAGIPFSLSEYDTTQTFKANLYDITTPSLIANLVRPFYFTSAVCSENDYKDEVSKDANARKRAFSSTFLGGGNSGADAIGSIWTVQSNGNSGDVNETFVSSIYADYCTTIAAKNQLIPSQSLTEIGQQYQAAAIASVASLQSACATVGGVYDAATNKCLKTAGGTTFDFALFAKNDACTDVGGVYNPVQNTCVKSSYWQLARKEVISEERSDNAANNPPENMCAGSNKVLISRVFQSDDKALSVNIYEAPLFNARGDFSTWGKVDSLAPSCPREGPIVNNLATGPLTREIGRIETNLFENETLCYGALNGDAIVDTRTDKSSPICPNTKDNSQEYYATVIVGGTQGGSNAGIYAPSNLTFDVGLFSPDNSSLQQRNKYTILSRVTEGDRIPFVTAAGGGCAAGDTSCSLPGIIKDPSPPYSCPQYKYNNITGAIVNNTNTSWIANRNFLDEDTKFGANDPLQLRTKTKFISVYANGEGLNNSINLSADQCDFPTTPFETTTDGTGNVKPNIVKVPGRYLAEGDTVNAAAASGFTYPVGVLWNVTSRTGVVTKQYTPWSSERADGNETSVLSCDMFSNSNPDAIAHPIQYPVNPKADLTPCLTDPLSADCRFAESAISNAENGFTINGTAIKVNPANRTDSSYGTGTSFTLESGGRWAKIGEEQKKLSLENSLHNVSCRMSIDGAGNDISCSENVFSTFETPNGFNFTIDGDHGGHGGNAGAIYVLTSLKPDSISLKADGGKAGVAAKGSDNVLSGNNNQKFTCYGEGTDPLSPSIKIYRKNESVISVSPGRDGNPGAAATDRSFYGWGVMPKALNWLNKTLEDQEKAAK